MAQRIVHAVCVVLAANRCCPRLRGLRWDVVGVARASVLLTFVTVGSSVLAPSALREPRSRGDVA